MGFTVKVLGCHGGELLDCRTTCLQVGERLLVDAGSIVSRLTIDQQVEIDDIVVSHSHLDHVKDLAMMGDIIAGRRKKPVRIHGSPKTIDAIKRHLFNRRLWPDFTRIPSAKNPVFTLHAFTPGRELAIGGVTFLPVPVAHPVESMGFIVKCPRGSFAISGDTGPTTRFWKEVNRTRDLRFMMVELSFPDEHLAIATISGHLTPGRLAVELEKVTVTGVPVMLYHFKPAHMGALKAQLPRIGRDDLFPLSTDDTFTF